MGKFLVAVLNRKMTPRELQETLQIDGRNLQEDALSISVKTILATDCEDDNLWGACIGLKDPHIAQFFEQAWQAGAYPASGIVHLMVSARRPAEFQNQPDKTTANQTKPH